MTVSLSVIIEDRSSTCDEDDVASIEVVLALFLMVMLCEDEEEECIDGLM